MHQVVNLRIHRVYVCATMVMLVLIVVARFKIVALVNSITADVNVIVPALIAVVMGVRTRIRNASVSATMVILDLIAAWLIPMLFARIFRAMVVVARVGPILVVALAIQDSLDPVARAVLRIATMAVWILIHANVFAVQVGVVPIAISRIPICYARACSVKMAVLRHTMANAAASVKMVGLELIALRRMPTSYVRACSVKMVAPKHLLTVSAVANAHLVGQAMIVAHLTRIFCAHPLHAITAVPKTTIMVNVVANVPKDLREPIAVSETALLNIVELMAHGTLILANAIVNPVFQVLRAQMPILMWFAQALIVPMVLKDTMVSALVRAKTAGPVPIAMSPILVSYARQPHVLLVKVPKHTIMEFVVANVCLDGKESIVPKKIVVPLAA